MASSFFARGSTKWLLAGSTPVAAIAYASLKPSAPASSNETLFTPAEEQFHSSYVPNHGPPTGWIGPVFKIRNDYPNMPPEPPRTGQADLPTLPGPSRPLPVIDPADDAPWLKVDFRKDPLRYSALIKIYCWEGNENNGFNIHKNAIRNWYHAPWMHWSNNGREPLNGLTFERSTPAGELSKTQSRILQTWACGYYNSTGASLFARVWADPNTPKWEENLKFPLGTCVFKILLTDATDEEVPTMKGSPSLQAVIKKQPTSSSGRNNFASNLRLLQMDWAVRDDRAPIGWVFGTYMFDGSQKEENAWDRIIPVGLMWGNDPDLNQKQVDSGSKPSESWINPVADALRISLGGTRPSWGWNGRMNGPADNFISACASCHSTASKGHHINSVPPKPVPPENDAQNMLWFRNIPSGVPFQYGSLSSDYSLQLQMGYYNFKAWETTPQGNLAKFWRGTKYAIPYSKTRREVDELEAKRGPLRAGPPQYPGNESG